jgi:hypothetical protein
MAIGQELLNVPMGDMIRQMAFAIAEAQVRLDESSIQVAEMMGGLKSVYDRDGKITFDDSRVFFGYEYMKGKDAKSFIAADAAYTGTPIETDIKGVDDNADVRVPTRMSMMELGFTPTFYQFVDTIIEVKIAIKITRETTYGSKSTDTLRTDTSNKSSKGGGIWSFFGGSSSNSSRSTVQTSQVDASYQAKYGYSAEGSSLLRTKLNPLPPPPILEERIRKMMEADEQRRQAKLPAPK